MSKQLQNIDLTPTQIATKLSALAERNISSRQVNQLLEQLGLQKKLKTSKSKSQWQLTERGKKYGRVYLVTSTHSHWSGNQIKWSEEVINLLQQHPIWLTA